MRLLKQAMAVMGTVTMITVLMTAVAPKAAHGLVATLVQIGNTTSNPVPTTLVGPAQPALLSCNSLNGGVCQFSVPAGKRFDVQTASFNAVGDSGNFMTSWYFVYTFQGQPTVMNVNVPAPLPLTGGGTVTNQTQELHAYIDPGTTVECRFFFYANNVGFSSTACILVGTFTDQP